MLALLPDAVEAARPADLDPETFELEFEAAAAGASRAAPACPVPLAHCRRPPPFPGGVL